MFKKLMLALALALSPSFALAQTKFTMPPPAGVTVGGVQVVTTCGTASGLVAGNTAFMVMDTTGALCTNATGGGGGAVTQGTIPWAEKIAQVGGTTTAVGSGVMTAGTLRTALATDSPGIVALGQTTKSASVPIASASDQVGSAGTSHATVLSVQGIASMTKLLVTPYSVALPSN